MIHAEVVAPCCKKCGVIYIIRAGLTITTGGYRLAWYPDCKCKESGAAVLVNDDGSALMLSLDSLAPRKAGAKALSVAGGASW